MSLRRPRSARRYPPHVPDDIPGELSDAPGQEARDGRAAASGQTRGFAQPGGVCAGARCHRHPGMAQLASAAGPRPHRGGPGGVCGGRSHSPHLLPQVTRVFLRCQRLGPRRQPSPRTSRKRRRLLVPGLKLPPLLRPADALGVSGPRSHPALRTVQGRGGGLCAPASCGGGRGRLPQRPPGVALRACTAQPGPVSCDLPAFQRAPQTTLRTLFLFPRNFRSLDLNSAGGREASTAFSCLLSFCVPRRCLVLCCSFPS